jgi:hypothetical protein
MAAVPPVGYRRAALTLALYMIENKRKIIRLTDAKSDVDYDEPRK